MCFHLPNREYPISSILYIIHGILVIFRRLQFCGKFRFFPVFKLPDPGPTRPSPNMSLKLWIKLLSAGIVFSIDSTATFFQLTVTGGSYTLALTIFDLASLIYSKISISLDLSPSNLWENLMLTTAQTSFTSITATAYYNYKLAFQTTLTDCDNSIGGIGSGYNWYLGDSAAGFGGFLYSVKGFNEIDISLQSFVNPPNCMADEYWNGITCKSCSGCGTWPWCSRSTCNLCYSDLCSSCTGFASSLCTAGGCSANCISCSSATMCTQCEVGFLLFAGTCVVVSSFDLMLYSPPYRMNSGSNPLTYFQKNQEADDPIPQELRGYYFASGMYLSTSDLILLPNNFLVYLWIKGYQAMRSAKAKPLP